MNNPVNENYRSTIMFQEILQEPETITNTVNSVGDNILKAVKLIRKAKIVYVVGSGTSYHAGIVMQIGLINSGVPAIAVRAPEFSYFTPPDNKDVLVILISQSGESRDILVALNLCRKNGYVTIGITNGPDSSLAKGTDLCILTLAGEERSLAATKSHIAQLIVSHLLVNSVRNDKKLDDYMEKSKKLASQIKDFIEKSDHWLKLSSKITGRVIFLGDGLLHAEAMEGALKFEETANLITEAYPMGEYLHGPIQVLKEEDTVIILKGRDEKECERLISKLSNYTKNIIKIGQDKDSTIRIPDSEIVTFDPILYVIPIQLIANYKTVSLGLDPDRPTHLNKVVK